MKTFLWAAFDVNDGSMLDNVVIYQRQKQQKNNLNASSLQLVKHTSQGTKKVSRSLHKPRYLCCKKSILLRLNLNITATEVMHAFMTNCVFSVIFLQEICTAQMPNPLIVFALLIRILECEFLFLFLLVFVWYCSAGSKMIIAFASIHSWLF